MNISREHQGELLILGSAFLWGLFPVVTILSYHSLSPLLSLSLGTLASSLFFGALMVIRRTSYQLKNKAALKDILWMTLITGIVFYVLYFLGLRYTSAGNASIIALSETLFSYLFFAVWRREHMPGRHMVGAALALLGAVIVLSPNYNHFMWGDILVLLAAFIAPPGNFFQRRARQQVNGEVVWFVRSLVAGLAVLALAYSLGDRVTWPAMQASWLVLTLNGVIIFGLSKFLWIESIARISVTKANALSVAAVVVTFLGAWLFLGQAPTNFQLLAFVPMALGVVLLSSGARATTQSIVA